MSISFVRKRLNVWYEGEENVNTAVKDIREKSPPEKVEAAIKAGMQDIFQAVPPTVMGLPPQAIVVPLGLHALNAVRIAALKEALETIGVAAVQSMQIYFVGGRKLRAEEKSAPLKDVMNFGLQAYCSADWNRLDKDSQDAFLKKFEDTSKQNLGYNQKLPEKAVGETDSARHIWENAPDLEGLAQASGRPGALHRSRQQ